MSPSDFHPREESPYRGTETADTLTGTPTRTVQPERWGRGGFPYGNLRAHVRNQSRQLVSAGPEKVEEDEEVEVDASRIKFDGRSPKEKKRRRRREWKEEEVECVRVTA